MLPLELQFSAEDQHREMITGQCATRTSMLCGVKSGGAFAPGSWLAAALVCPPALGGEPAAQIHRLGAVCAMPARQAALPPLVWSHRVQGTAVNLRPRCQILYQLQV
jgi:hypothetical protein